MKTIDKVFDPSGKLLAMIIPAEYSAEGIQFFTPNEFSQQLAYMNRPQNYIIAPHVHTPVPRSVDYTLEVLFVRKGKVQVDFFDSNQKYLEKRIIKTGDVILLASGGHGFTMLEPTEMIEVKQGPYAGDKDKIRFKPPSL
jgi:mannose-6-phosphate isomerase-like protein (cupin superfamily)